MCNWPRTWKNVRNVLHGYDSPLLIYIDLDVLVHNSGNNWGAPFEEYVLPPLPYDAYHPMPLTNNSPARRSMVPCLRIKSPKTLHINTETPPLTSQIPISTNNPHWLHLRDQCPWTRNICLFSVEGWVTPLISGFGCETWTEGGQS